MKHTKNILKSLLIMIVAISLFTVSCSKDEGGSKPTNPTPTKLEVAKQAAAKATTAAAAVTAVAGDTTAVTEAAKAVTEAAKAVTTEAAKVKDKSTFDNGTLKEKVDTLKAAVNKL